MKPNHVCLGLFLLAWLLWTAETTAKQPNIILILADDLGYADIGCYDSPDAETPAIDSLATEGLKFNHFYAMAPQCTPSRTAILTGRYPQRAGGLECAIGTGNVGRYDEAIRLAAEGELGLPPRLAVLAPGLKQAGFHNAMFGKWHLGYDPQFHPMDQGFDEFTGFLGGNVEYFGHYELSDLDVYLQGRQRVSRDGYLTDLITDDAVEYLDRRAQDPETPFFLFVSHAAPHFPFQGPGEADAPRRTEANWMDGTRQDYLQMITSLDHGVGRILEALHRNRQAENTLVIFSSDHGAMPPGLNTPWRDFKSTTFEGGLRVPCIARWPAKIVPGSESDQVGTLMDLTTSFLHLANADSNHQGPLDGIDILDHVLAGRELLPRQLCWRYRRGTLTWSAIRDGQMKWVSRRDGDEHEQWLFDLADDPTEQIDLAEQRPDALETLRTRFAAWEEDVVPVR